MSNKELELFNTPELSEEAVEGAAFETGFCRRKSGKIHPVVFLFTLCIEAIKGAVSYNDLAAKIEAKTGINASRQAYHQRMKRGCDAFLLRILEIVIEVKQSLRMPKELSNASPFKRILVQDSTVIRLPSRLFAIFSGVKNAHSTVCNARIQGVYDLLARRFIWFSIDSYSKNDLSAAHEIPAEPGDLIVRDRGYFIISVIERFKRKGADTISRYKSGIDLYHVKNGKKIDLLKLLKKKGTLDMIVLVGAKEKYKMRLMAAHVNEETANLRRMKLKKESRNKNPSARALQLCSWTIFLTTVEDPSFTFDLIFKLYALRWRIENIFKVWKSFFNFDNIHNVSCRQLKVLLRARLIMIVLLNRRVYNPLSELVKERAPHKRLSMMKFMRYIIGNLDSVARFLHLDHIGDDALRAVLRFCTYASRKRENFEECFEAAFQ